MDIGVSDLLRTFGVLATGQHHVHSLAVRVRQEMSLLICTAGNAALVEKWGRNRLPLEPP